jgi:hypothetical protein
MRWLAVAAIAMMGCSGDKAPVDDSFANLGDEKADSFSRNLKVVGSFASGASFGSDVAYAPSPRYRAVKVLANPGDQLLVHVSPQFLGKGTPNPADPVTWLLDGSFRKIDFSDDTSQNDLSSTIVATLPRSRGHAYWAVFRDYNLAAVQMSVEVDLVRMTGDYFTDATALYDFYFATAAGLDSSYPTQFKIDFADLPQAAQDQSAAYKKAAGSSDATAYLFYVGDQPLYVAAYPIEEFYWVDLYDGDGNFLAHGANGDGDANIDSWSQTPADPAHP